MDELLCAYNAVDPEARNRLNLRDWYMRLTPEHAEQLRRVLLCVASQDEQSCGVCSSDAASSPEWVPETKEVRMAERSSCPAIGAGSNPATPPTPIAHKLWLVTILATYEEPVLAETQHEAQDIALREYDLGKITIELEVGTFAEPLCDRYPNAIPWGGDGKRTCAEYSKP